MYLCQEIIEDLWSSRTVALFAVNFL